MWLDPSPAIQLERSPTKSSNSIELAERAMIVGAAMDEETANSQPDAKERKFDFPKMWRSLLQIMAPRLNHPFCIELAEIG